MNNSITRERLEALANAEYCKSNPGAWLLGLKEVNELARMALAAMDSESWCLPLDYLQGHKDGLEFASQLAEANHPETGDWLYDDPIELAKAIRKGPDMPPAQPAADSEPDRNPVLAYADSYRDMAKQGVESVPIWSVITDLERNIAPLYRHAQQPVVPASQKEPISFDEWSRKCALQITLCYPDFREKAKYIWDSARETQQPAMVVPDELKEAAADFLTVLDEYPEQLVPINRDSAVVRALRAAMLPENPVCTCPSGDGSLRWPCPVHPGNSPVIPDGYVMVPVEPNGDMLAAAQDAYGETDGDIASTLRAAMLAAAPQPQNAPQNIPEIIPDCWCRTCRPVTLNDMRFVVCPDCGNKRCPRANDHRNACTGSNEPGQEGSAYPDTSREVKGE